MLIVLLAALSCDNGSHGGSYPSFSDESEVVIRNYAGDAMEAFICSDGKTLFFNSLNDAVNTSIYYATGSDGIVFDCGGPLDGVNELAPHLDAVASIDDGGKFYCISTRNYTNSYRTVYCGTYSNAAVTDLKALSGDFYIEEASWIVMDAEISRDGKTLFFVNAKFVDNVLVRSFLGIAEYDEGSESFLKRNDSDEMLQVVNDSDYLVYAPSLSADGTELYFTRVAADLSSSEICVAHRKNNASVFEVPRKIGISGYMAEAVSISASGDRIYYHKKNSPEEKWRIFSMKVSR